MELTDSVRYREGIDERVGFGGFCDWALGLDAQGLTVHLSHPIVPQSGRNDEEGERRER